VMAFLSPEERVRVFSLVSKEAARGAAALKRSAKFGKPLFGPAGAALVLGIAYGSGATVRGAPSASALLQAAALPAQTDRAFGLFDGRRGETLVSPCVRQDTGWALAEPPYAKKISELDPTATYVVLEQDPIVADVQASVGDSAIIVDHLAVQAFWGTDAQRLDGEDELVPLYVRPSVFVRPKTPRFQRASA